MRYYCPKCFRYWEDNHHTINIGGEHWKYVTPDGVEEKACPNCTTTGYTRIEWIYRPSTTLPKHPFRYNDNETTCINKVISENETLRLGGHVVRNSTINNHTLIHRC